MNLNFFLFFERTIKLDKHISNQDEKKSNKEEIAKKDDFEKVGRNEKCPCGSGKKYKHCHGNL